jgi:hypothetical protein
LYHWFVYLLFWKRTYVLRTSLLSYYSLGVLVEFPLRWTPSSSMWL